MPSTRSPILFLFLFSGLLFFGIPPTSLEGQTPYERVTRNHDRSLSDIYLEYAVSAFSDEAFDRADELAETAILFDGASPDALYIRGFAAAEAESFSEAARYLSEALLFEKWRHYEPREAGRHLAEIYYRTGRVEDAYHQLRTFYTSVLDSSGTAALYVKILVKLGFIERAEETVRGVQRKFPSDGSLQVLRMRLDAAYLKDVLEKMRAGDPQELYSRETFREALYKLAVDAVSLPAYDTISGIEFQNSLDNPRGESTAALDALLGLYKQRWGEDRFSGVIGLVADKLSEGSLPPEAWRDIVDGYTRFTDREFFLLRSMVGDEDKLSANFASFTGEVLYDSDRDGYVDRRVEYIDGKIDRIGIDEDQNSRPEKIVHFEENEVRRLELFGAREIEARYGRYPKLVSVTFRDRGSEGELHMDLVPYELGFDSIVEEEWGPLYPPRIREADSFPELKSLLPYAARIERRSEEGQMSYSAGDGKSVLTPTSQRHGQVVGFYRDAELQRRLRDVDGDDAAEITEVYRDGKLLYISYDGNGNNRAEYLEKYEEGVLIRLWDIDEDGTYDYEMKIENPRREEGLLQ